ncbi:odorant receptor 9a-like [Prorops nasuta]|uniref:odorant receptor 9a-like n=1 Tax=Prorops nasuta TaxID=863751 RepID=UPI0034CF95CB
MIPQSANLFRVYNNLMLVTENLAVINFIAIIASMKFIVMKYNRKVYKNCFYDMLVLSELLGFYAKDLENAKVKEDIETMKQSEKISNRMSIMGNVLGLGTVVIYMIQRFFLIATAKMKGLERIFVFQSLFPEIFKVTPHYELVCLSQLMGGFMITTCYVSVDSLIYVLIFNICAQLQILRKELNEVINLLGIQQCPDDFQQAIRIVVRKHEHLNWCVKTVEDSFNYCFLVQALLSTLLMCFQAFMTFQAMAISDNIPVNDIVFLIVYITVVMLLIHFYCYMGEELLISSSELSDGVFESNWYSLSSRNIKMLTFIIFRSRIPLQLTAGKFNVLSMETYANIVKAAVGYFSVMVQLETGRQQTD